MKILIVEDEGDVCFLLNLMLKEDYVTIEHVNTIAQTKVFLKEETPDIIIIDNKLPDGHGIDFIPEIKTNHPSTKVIMISGNSGAADREKAVKNGADQFISKPFTKLQIQKALSELTEYSSL